MPTTTATGAKKRTATSRTASASKKSKTTVRPAFDPYVDSIVSNADAFVIPDDPEEIRAKLLQLAEYARTLEEEIQASKPKVKSEAEVVAEAEKLANAARSGIRKSMAWKPSCKHSAAKWTYDGVCQDATVFGKLMGLDGPPSFKQKKFSIDDFENLIGDCTAPIRYGTLYQKSDINVRWNPDEGTFKLSGSYGLPSKTSMLD